MNRILSIIFFLLPGISIIAQKPAVSNTKPVDARLVSHLTSKPEFPGGDSALIVFIYKNLNYPQMERDNDVHGTVKIRVVVDTSGTVVNPEIVKSISRGLDREALRVIKMLPKWKPAMYYKKSVPVYYILNVNFVLK